MKTSILFLIFNRVENTRKVFATIRQSHPLRLYVAADGPRLNRPGEYELCQQARKIATEVDWPCEVKTLFRENNLGCGKAVSQAITWFFEQESEGIILEDDCVPDLSFFKFCEELLEKFKDEPRVMMISGNFIGAGLNKRTQKLSDIKTSYFFSRHVDCWGWASWRRAWKLFDYHIVEWSHLRDNDWLLKVGDGNKKFQKSWERRFQLVQQGLVDTWDYQWVFSIWSHNSLSITPTRNLVKNIGYDGEATHTKRGDGVREKLPIGSIEFPLLHPNLLERNQEMDKIIDQLYISINKNTKRSSKLRGILRSIRYLFGEKYYVKLSRFVKWILFTCRNYFSREECFITCSGKRDGPGAQALAIMSTMLFADKMHLKYVHTPFITLQHNNENDVNWENKWENFFNLGKGELNISDNHLKISREISLGESPLMIRKQANTLFILRHCHEYTDMFPNQYSRLKEIFVEKYDGSPKGNYELYHVPGKVNVAIHIRRGDVSGSNQFSDKFTEDSFILNVISRILERIILHGLEPSLAVYSEGSLSNFRDFERLHPKLFLGTDPFTTFHNLVRADVLVMSKSTFSYTAAVLSNGIIFYEPFRHIQQEGWIKINGKAQFNTKLFSRKLLRYVNIRQ